MPRTPGDRRSQLVLIAYQLIATRGLEGLRFADVARAAGINNGTLLYYFESKDALIQAVGAYLVQQYSQAGASAAELEPLAQLREEFADARDHLGSDLGVVYTELLARATRDPKVAELLRDIDANWRSWLSYVLERGRASGVFRADLDVDHVATAVMATIRGVGVQALVAGAEQSVAPVMDSLARQIEAWIVTPD